MSPALIASQIEENWLCPLAAISSQGFWGRNLGPRPENDKDPSIAQENVIIGFEATELFLL